MRCTDLRAALAAVGLAALAALSACGGGTTTVVTYTWPPGTQPPVDLAQLTEPTGPNTTEIVVDTGPVTGFSLGAANIPYVTVTVCVPGSSTACTTIDHVILDTGSYGLRTFKSKVAALGLPPVTVAANPQAVPPTPHGNAVECYPFVVGGLWGPLAQADVRIAGELASQIPIQLIDDSGSAASAAPADCATASGQQVLSTVTALQANGVLGVGMVGLDCGATCALGDYTGQHVQYYVCTDATTASCVPAAVPNAQQTQNPVKHFAVNNNGTVIHLPALPLLGATVAKGRLVFGIGTDPSGNNQIAPSAKSFAIDTNPGPDPKNLSPTYLYITTDVGANRYIQSYIDSGSNALFFDDTSISQACGVSTGSTQSGWFCPASTLTRTATLTDAQGYTGSVDFSIANADGLFSTNSTAFGSLGGAAGQGAQTFVWGLPFFYGRSVYTSIWGQSLAANGPWYAFCSHGPAGVCL
jgi:hypothetical protein